MKTLFLLFAFLTCLVSAESPARVITPVESPPKVIDGLEFSVVTQSEWRHPAYFIHEQYESIVIQLRITNRGDKAILFPTFDSFHVNLKTPGGKVLVLAGGRDATLVTPNILLLAGKGFSLQLDAKIEYSREGKSKVVDLIIKDGTGSIAQAKLGAGDYSISFELSPTPYDFEKGGKLSALLWSGKGTTESIGFRVTSP